MKAFSPVRPRTLGWFSIGLGLAELLASRGLSRLIGVRDHRPLVRVLGLREITSGVGILTRRRPTGWLWSRVAGDAMDLALLGAAFRSYRGRPVRLAATATAVAGVTLLDVICSRELSRARRRWFDVSSATELLRPATGLLRRTELLRPTTGLLRRMTQHRRWW